MKLANRLTMLGAALLVLLFLAYLSYQVAQNLSAQMVTVDAVEVTVEDKLSSEGAFLRDQVNVHGGDGNSAEYLVSDGEKVAAGEPLAVYFDSDTVLRQYQDCEDLRDQLKAMKYARENVAGGADSLKMDELIRRQIVTLNGELSTGASNKADDDYARLRQLIVSRGATKDDKAAFDTAIAKLQSEITVKEQALGSGSKTVSAPVSGYFLSYCDGWETILTSAARDSLSPDEILNAKANPDPDAVGTVTDEFNWYFAAVITVKEADAIRGRSTITVYFPELSASALSVDLVSIRNCDDGNAVVLLRSGVINAQYLAARRQPLDMVIGSYTGLKVPAEALRQVDGVWGVYVLDGSVARFKPVTWTYQTGSYFLVPSAKEAKDGLYRYDKIILRAKDLADKKVMD